MITWYLKAYAIWQAMGTAHVSFIWITIFLKVLLWSQTEFIQVMCEIDFDKIEFIPANSVVMNLMTY